MESSSEHKPDRLAHEPVLLDAVVHWLAPPAGGVVLDCTAGDGGHASALGRRLGPGGTVVLCDLDPGCLAKAAGAVRQAVGAEVRVVEINASYAETPRRLVDLGLSADRVIADLGFSSRQMDDGARGFSFRREGPLDMRFGTSGPTAADLVNTLPERELADLLHDLGEERKARAIAAKIVAERAREPIRTTGALAKIVRAVVAPFGRGPEQKIDPATRTFQALRIAVNDELGNLDALLSAVTRQASQRASGAGGGWLGPDARVGIIAFHSLEDRRVKQAFGALADRSCARVLTKKPIEATPEEVERNARSRSAKLRVIELGVA
ncbi:MAG: 16S rRNA (cytosine(1402)-N(4))-methyltransferase RsmH [Phycisphaerales bacterium]|nr:16S rRNA (cytosine(1402)-N(4))-methyltransferase RsmH [Phycisphaerales bacterium]